MYEKVSDQISRLSADIIVAGMSRKDMNDFLSTVSPEDVKEAIRVLKSPKEKLAGAKTRDAIILLNILTMLLGSALAGPAREDAAKKLGELQNKGKITVESITDFKADLPKESLEVGGDVLEDINALMTKARRAPIKPGYSAVVQIGGEKMTVTSPEALEAGKAVNKLVKDLSKVKHTNPSEFAKRLKIVVDAFKAKTPIKFS